MEFGYEGDDRGGEENKRTKGGGEADEGRDRRSCRKVGLGEEMEELKKEFKKQEAKWKKRGIEEIHSEVRERDRKSEDEGGRRDGRGKDSKGEGREGMSRENERDRAETGEKKAGGKLQYNNKRNEREG